MKPKFLENRSCYVCSKEFSFTLRRHHCRNCGRSVCAECSNNEVSIPKLGYYDPVRVCGKCHQLITKIEAADDIDDVDDDKNYDYDVIVIGGGSGGLAFAKEAAKFGKRVAVADYVSPTPQGTTWGLGGTCVNVGCIPKKLMHQAGLLGEFMEDAKAFGWNVSEKPQHSWQKLVEGIQRYIASLNLSNVKTLKSEKVRYFNAEAKFVDPHSVLLIQYQPPTVPKYMQDKDSKSASQPPEKERDSDSESREGESQPGLKEQDSVHEPEQASLEPKMDQEAKPIIQDEPKPKAIRKTARRVVIAVGGRPSYPDIPGAKEYAVTSDDIFSLKRHPGKEVLVVGASYVALECAGFLKALGCNVTVLVRSILLRGFDQEMANRIGKYMEAKGVKFIYGGVPTKIEKADEKGEQQAYKVTWTNAPVSSSTSSSSSIVSASSTSMALDSSTSSIVSPSSTSLTSSDSSAAYTPEFGVEGGRGDSEPEVHIGIFNTVLLAIGRYPLTKTLNLPAAGVKLASNGKINIRQEQTNVPHIYALGDVAIPAHGPAGGGLELTPVAIQAGRLLARRLYANSKVQMNYFTVPTTVFTPLEYGCVGLSEEEAGKRFGEKNLKVYYTTFQPLEFTLSGRGTDEVDSYSYGKIICDKKRGELIVGFHYLGPNAGEVTQGYACAIKAGATRALFEDTVGIHPTNSERMVMMEKVKPGPEEEPAAAAPPEDC